MMPRALLAGATLLTLLGLAAPAGAGRLGPLECDAEDNEPALLGWCRKGVQVTLPHASLITLVGTHVAPLSVSAFQVADRSLHLVQVAGLAISKEYFGGVQIGGVLLVNRFYGLLQVSLHASRFVLLIFGASSPVGVESFYGVAQVSLWTQTERFAGLAQVGIVANQSLRRLAGLQVGLFNAANRVLGAELGGVNSAEEVAGLQLGLYNQAERVRGVQLGIVNWAGSLAGVQLGLLNGSRTGLLRWLPIFNLGWR